MLSASAINAHISKRGRSSATILPAIAECAESYDFVVEFQVLAPAKLAISIIRGCTPCAQYNRCKFSA
jgi:hypothetical protein